MAPDDSGATTRDRLADEGLQLVGDLIRAADTLLAALDTDAAVDVDDVGELRALTQAMRHMAFLVLAEHNPDQAWFWTPEWQAGERQADEDKAVGRFTRYDSGDEFLAALRAERPDVADLRYAGHLRPAVRPSRCGPSTLWSRNSWET